MSKPNVLRMLIAAQLAVGTGAVVAAGLTDVPTANTRVTGQSRPNVLSPELDARLVAIGSMALENPSALAAFYGYDATPSDVSMQFVPAPNSMEEASKTAPDKNVYLRLFGQQGADVAYDYGNDFLFQGHEMGRGGYLTRVNLDADVKHRVTLMADKDVNGQALPTFDGITWDPFARVLLLTAEAGSNGGVWQATAGFPSQVTDISAFLGRGGYEGVQTDSDGNIWLVEDAGGAKGTGANNRARRPNSFVYRFVPNNRFDLTRGGKLQALQVMKKGTDCRNGTVDPIVYDGAMTPDQAAFTQDVADLHTYGNRFCTRWVDLSLDAGHDANAAAKAAGATPFKRPENGVFQPGTGFRRFFFTETGDTNATSSANDGYGGFGGVYVLSQHGPSADTGVLELFYAGDLAHTGFDNIQFFSHHHLMVVEDAGDTLHSQRNALDSGYVFDTRASYAGGLQPIRFLAEGRDPSATLDSMLSGSPGFQNDGDNEITGIHVSDGDPTPGGLLGARLPHPFEQNWRIFFTQQHGNETTWEIVPGDDPRGAGFGHGHNHWDRR